MRRTTIVFFVIVGLSVAVAVLARVGSGQMTAVTGLIGSEKAPFFADERVQKALARHRLQVTVQKAGSREIATRPDLRSFGFAFPAGVPGAEKIQEVTIITFNGEVHPPRHFRIDNVDPQGPDMQRIREFVAGLEAGGGTAIYSALAEAYRQAAAAQAQEPDRYYSIVLMSDGISNTGMNAKQFNDFYRGLSPTARGIRTFTVIFGKADRPTMEQIAAVTGGRSFDGVKDPLDFIFKQIRGYQ